MLTSIFLNTIANVSILSMASYILVKLIPKKRHYTLGLKQKLWMIGVSSATSFLLMLFSVDMPQDVKLDLRHVIFILLVYYFGSSIAVPTIFVASLLRFLLGVNSASIRAAAMYAVLALIVPILSKKLTARFNQYAVMVMLNMVFVLASALNLYFLYYDRAATIAIFFSLLLLSSGVVIIVTLFTEDLRKSFSLYLDEQEHAKMDFLTGLYNVREFNKKWQKIQIDKSIKTTAFIMLDIDHFKWINDNYGHANGNFVLRQLATILKIEAPDNELVYRIGGEEFCLILNDLSYTDQQKVAEQIRAKVAEKEFLLENGNGIQLTVSVGLAASAQNKDMKKLFRLADRCLYDAKNQGRNQVVGSTMETE
ncbi:GGDEF domain-containing protein [Carnobacterium mobile]|uniref:GGDEF domain-containing protein n=1 Tax=Carnobacterium mobile TaxID=2750 RepID=UPI00055799A3|nr:GGDEF domain-containing protein [Carnobacterium mobile]